MLIASLFSTPISAAEKDRLDRMEPVPANEPIPVRDFFRPHLFSNPELNPAGTHFAATAETEDGVADLMAYDLSAKTIERLTPGEDFDIPSYSWLSDTRLLFTLTEENRYSRGLFAVELGQFSKSFVLQRTLAIAVLGYPQSQPRQAIIWLPYHGTGSRGAVLKVDTRKKLRHANRDIGGANTYRLGADVLTSYLNPTGGEPVGYLLDCFGELAFAFTVEDGVAAIHRLEGGKWTPCAIDLKEIEIVGVGDRPSELLVLAQKEVGKPRALHRLDAKTGAFGELLLQDDRFDFRNARFYRHPVDRRVLGAHYDRKNPQSVWFDPRYGEIQNALNRAFPKDMVRILGSDRAEMQFVVAVFSDVRPMAYHQVNLAASSATIIADVVPWIDPKRMQPMMPITYKSRDGFEIEGYVTLPVGASETNKVPLVVLPHAAPWARTIWAWDAEAQFFASRGYAVFQPNYRGSIGTMWRFPDEDMWDLRKMHNDVTDGVKTVLRTGLIDPDRLAILGGSLGGYLAVSGAVHEPDLYRCGLTIAGVFDWDVVLKDARRSMYERGQFGILKRDVENLKTHEGKFAEDSPMHRVNEIKVPIFVAHGEDDVVPSVAQSKQLLKRLEKFGVPHETHIYGGEGRSSRRLDRKIKLYTAIETFLGKHLAPRAPTVATGGVPAAAGTN